MTGGNFEYDDLPVDSLAAFVAFEDYQRAEYNRASNSDRNDNSDQNMNYVGNYGPERTYVMTILAFLDEYNLETELIDISDLENASFAEHFGKFKSKVDYTVTRFKLRSSRLKSGSMGTAIAVTEDYKSQISEHISKIRKIVNQEIPSGRKKEEISKKLSALQLEVDRDLTTVDAVFSYMLDLSRTVGGMGENLKPAIDQLERIKKLFWDNSKKVEQLPKPERPKAIEDKTSKSLDDEIPF